MHIWQTKMFIHDVLLTAEGRYSCKKLNLFSSLSHPWTQTQLAIQGLSHSWYLAWLTTGLLGVLNHVSGSKASSGQKAITIQPSTYSCYWYAPVPKAGLRQCEVFCICRGLSLFQSAGLWWEVSGIEDLELPFRNMKNRCLEEDWFLPELTKNNQEMSRNWWRLKRGTRG